MPPTQPATIQPVLIRRWKSDGTIAALIPGIPSYTGPHHCEMWQHGDQKHSERMTVEPSGFMANTAPIGHANKTERAVISRLTAHIRAAGYKIKIVRRVPLDAYKQRAQAWRAAMES